MSCAILLAGTACGTQTPQAPQDGGVTTGPALEAGVDISIRDFKHSPSTITVKPGATVTVKNFDIAGHTVTSDESGIFDTGLVSKDQTLTFTAPSEPGEYPFHCTPHPYMKGILIVQN